MKALSEFCILCATAIFCVSCASSPVVGYRAGFGRDKLVVTSDFKFTTGPSSISHMEHTWTVPAGVYREVGTDSSGTYYASPEGWVRLKARHEIQMYGGLYRRGNTFFTYMPAPPSLTGKLLIGSKPYIYDPLPPEFTKFVERQFGSNPYERSQGR